MNDEQEQFFNLVDSSMPALSHLFDHDRLVYKKDKVDEFLGICSTGEMIMCRFFLMVWCGRNVYDFDLSDIGRLDEQNRAVIAQWVANPFYP